MEENLIDFSPNRNEEATETNCWGEISIKSILSA